MESTDRRAIKTGNRTWNVAVETAGEGKWDAATKMAGTPVGSAPFLWRRWDPLAFPHVYMSRLHVRIHVLFTHGRAGEFYASLIVKILLLC